MRPTPNAAVRPGIGIDVLAEEPDRTVEQQEMRASVVLLSPTGGKALAQVVNDLYVVTVPYVGGETPTVSVAKPEAAAFLDAAAPLVGALVGH